MNKYSIKATPTFIFLQYSKELTRLQSPNKKSIKETINEFYKNKLSEISHVRHKVKFFKITFK